MKANAPRDAWRSDASPTNLVAIHELASSYGVSDRTLRYYEELGLLTSHRKRGTRHYDPDQRARLDDLLRGRRLGLSLREMTALLKANGDQTQEILSLTEQIELVDAERRQEDQNKTTDEICVPVAGPIGQAAGAPFHPVDSGQTARATPLAEVTNAQLREARRLLNWSIRDLARCANVRMKAITQAETEARHQGPAKHEIVRALQAAGVEFTFDEPLGVRFDSEALRERNAELTSQVEAGIGLVDSLCRMEIRLVATEITPASDAAQLFHNLQQRRRVLETAGVEFIRKLDGETVARMTRTARPRRTQR